MMIKSQPSAVFLDIDGTLLSGTVPQRNAEAICRVQKEGHKVLINTGRAYGFIPFDKLAPIRFDGICAGAGAYVSVGGKVLRNRNADGDFIRRVVRFYFDCGKSIFFEGEEFCFALNPEPGFDIGRFGARKVLVLSSADEWDECHKDKKITKVALWRTEVGEDELALLGEQFRVLRHATYTETVLHGVDKADGMKAALAALGIPRQRSIAMGDSDNDIEMLTYAGVSVAMGNATENVRAICRMRTSCAKDAGVADALDRLLP